jgi:ssRNA-specific RNase YbeY (16S rRNA maturation enzyme)
MPVRLVVQNGPFPDVAPSEVARRARAMMAEIKRKSSELSIVLTNDEQMHELNKLYRDKDRPTDVLAFAMSEGEFSELSIGLLGDVIISVPTAARQARERRDTSQPRCQWRNPNQEESKDIPRSKHETKEVDARKMDVFRRTDDSQALISGVPRDATVKFPRIFPCTPWNAGDTHGFARVPDGKQLLPGPERSGNARRLGRLTGAGFLFDSDRRNTCLQRSV